MKIILSVLILILEIAFLSCSREEDVEPLSSIKADSIPCNPDISVNAKAILKYIAGLSTENFRGTIAGQNCMHGNQITSYDSLDAFNNLVVKLHDNTSKWIGMIGLDYECDKIFTQDELSQANKVLIDYWNMGGLITLNWTPHNPWINDESDIINNPGKWHHPYISSPNYIASQVNLFDLTNPTKEIYKVWRRKLDRIAAALTELQNAGVVVLWRPMQEMNGIWFWYGFANHPNDPKAYINLYRDMYDYFTNTKGLNNLLWVYSPAQRFDTKIVKPVDWRYPGHDYVDIVAVTAYGDSLTVDGYETCVRLGKPVALGEYGMNSEGDYANIGSFDNRNYLNKIKSTYPRMAYFVIWHNWDWGNGRLANMAIISNKFPNELMNNEEIITLDKLKWKQ